MLGELRQMLKLRLKLLELMDAALSMGHPIYVTMDVQLSRLDRLIRREIKSLMLRGLGLVIAATAIIRWIWLLS